MLQSNAACTAPQMQQTRGMLFHFLSVMMETHKALVPWEPNYAHSLAVAQGQVEEDESGCGRVGKVKKLKQKPI